jgi:hypothetical protein
MKEHQGKSGWVSHEGNYEPHLGTGYGHRFCNKPSLLNKGNHDITLDNCVNMCKNNDNCDYLTHGKVRGNPNRSCHLRWKDWNKDTSYPTGRPCIPQPGKNNCDMCFLYNVKTVPGTDTKEIVSLDNNDMFVTLTKEGVNTTPPNMCNKIKPSM